MNPAKRHSAEQLSEALRAITSLIGKLQKVVKKLRPGTAQASLAKNRLKALRVAATLIRAAASERTK